MALEKVVSQNDVGLKLSRLGPTSLDVKYGLVLRSRRATDVNGETEHASEHDARRHTIDCGDCL